MLINKQQEGDKQYLDSKLVKFSRKSGRESIYGKTLFSFEKKWNEHYKKKLEI